MVSSRTLIFGEERVKKTAPTKSRRINPSRKANVLRSNAASRAKSFESDPAASEISGENSDASAVTTSARELSRQVEKLQFSAPVAFWYNPLNYAWAPHQLYLQKYAAGRKKVIWLGMNPGPWGMAQTGVPFGEINMVKNWLEVEAEVHSPADEDPRRPITGFRARRSEVSGRRVWGLFAERYASAQAFAQDNFVMNWCPLIFFSDAAVNITPDKIATNDRARLYDLCDEHLRSVVAATEAEIVVGIGRFAFERARDALVGQSVKVGQILHPSPASPRANRGWAKEAMTDLAPLGLSL
jgi:single-strand selective monofunctional uracil DNA glycosylase